MGSGVKGLKTVDGRKRDVRICKKKIFIQVYSTMKGVGTLH